MNNVTRDVILKKLRGLFAMLHNMAERGQGISQESRCYWTGRYEQLLDVAHTLGVIMPNEDTSWRQAFGTELALLTDAKAMQTARERHTQEAVQS